jgi:DNA segregation ATPase FtsK/SpoIIIE, S-DNA-T family
MQTILSQLKIKADIVGVENNGTISKYYIRLHPGTKVSKIENCATEIALGVKAYSKPIIRIIPEQGLVCIELLTKQISNVNFSEFDQYFDGRLQESGNLPMILGRTHDGLDLITDLSTMPHLLIAGTTGSGKSVLLHSILASLIKANDYTKFALIDPKQVELSYYDNISNLLYPVITDAAAAEDVLSDLVEEMEMRFKLLNKASVNNIVSYNKVASKKLSYIVLAIDEFSDLMHASKKAFQTKLCVLAQKSRACGIHIIIATQRPSVDVITGLIKANFPARISCKVSSLIDSRVVLDRPGAEKLLGHGDALINSGGLDMVRFQCAYINTEEIQKLCNNRQRTKWSKILNYF